MKRITGKKSRVSAQLKGLEAIATVFGVGLPMVRRWIREGAPVIFIGRCYQVNYSRLCVWLEKHYSARELGPQSTLFKGGGDEEETM